MTKIELVELGSDIILYEGGESAVLAELKDRHRFMNVLWLPCSPNRLSMDQILVVNRFRESRFDHDAQFSHANRSRGALIELLSTFKFQSVLEIGCGKFPIANDLSIASYRGIDIDCEAIKHCRRLGLDVGTIEDFAGVDKSEFEVAVSLYALHFSVSHKLVSYICRCLASSACLVFNLITADGEEPGSELKNQFQIFPIYQIVKNENLATREYFVVMGRKGNQHRVEEIAETLGHLFEV